MAEDDQKIIEHLRDQSKQVGEALCTIIGEPPEGVDDPHWVIVPLRLPTAIAALMAFLAEHSRYQIHIMYANVLLRGLWAMGNEEDVPDVARAAALLIRDHATEGAWESWSARYPRAQEYVKEAQMEEAMGEETDERAT